MFNAIRNLFSKQRRDPELEARLGKLRQQLPVPVFWLFGKTQSGKTSIIRFLTGADDAEIGQGFRPCTRHSRRYHFPTPEAPLLIFLDTRGLDEPGYDPAEDLAEFNKSTQAVLVTVKALDHAQEHVLQHLQTIRQAQPTRPVVLVPTCLHEAYPQQQHPEPYPFRHRKPTPDEFAGDDDLSRSLAEHLRRFQGLVDAVVPVDLTRPEEGLAAPNYGGDHLREVLIDVLPAAYRQTLVTLAEARKELEDITLARVLPHIVGYSVLAAAAGALPVPWLDLLILPGIQTRMIYHLARLHGQPLNARRFLELAGTLGVGLVARQAIREVAKLIPVAGSVTAAALAGASTFALGKACCRYYRAVHQGHVPPADELKRLYHEELKRAMTLWTPQRAAPAAEHTGP
ncbi:MAG: GTP-binding DUF697 domain-containing protein [Gemmataceae bacterium]|nr:GTP-binding DUF697 domain-containing protein [Gemmataceae bacterium]MDW8265449.1 DUF697 domain-containing protein [Gemmataceae bacterium]